MGGGGINYFISFIYIYKGGGPAEEGRVIRLVFFSSIPHNIFIIIFIFENFKKINILQSNLRLQCFKISQATGEFTKRVREMSSQFFVTLYVYVHYIYRSLWSQTAETTPRTLFMNSLVLDMRGIS